MHISKSVSKWHTCCQESNVQDQDQDFEFQDQDSSLKTKSTTAFGFQTWVLVLELKVLVLNIWFLTTSVSLTYWLTYVHCAVHQEAVNCVDFCDVLVDVSWCCPASCCYDDRLWIRLLPSARRQLLIRSHARWSRCPGTSSVWSWSVCMINWWLCTVNPKLLPTLSHLLFLVVR